MSDIDKFQTSVKAILDQYKARDIEYYDAIFLVDEEMDAFLVRHATDMSDEYREVAFKAYADLQILTYQEEDMISREEAYSNIFSRALDMFEDVRSPEDIDQILRPYEVALDSDGEEQDFDTPPQHVDDGDCPGFFGPFSLN